MVILSFVTMAGYSLLDSSNILTHRQISNANDRNDTRVSLMQLTEDIQQSLYELEYADGKCGMYINDESDIYGVKSVIYEWDEANKELCRILEGQEPQVLASNVNEFQVSEIEENQYLVKLSLNNDTKEIRVSRRIVDSSIDIDDDEEEPETPEPENPDPEPETPDLSNCPGSVNLNNINANYPGSTFVFESYQKVSKGYFDRGVVLGASNLFFNDSLQFTNSSRGYLFSKPDKFIIGNKNEPGTIYINASNKEAIINGGGAGHNISTQETIEIYGDLYIDGNAKLGGNIIVHGNIYVTGNLTIENGGDYRGEIHVGKNLTFDVKGSPHTIRKNVYVKEKLLIKSDYDGRLVAPLDIKNNAKINFSSYEWKKFFNHSNRYPNPTGSYKESAGGGFTTITLPQQPNQACKY